MYQTMKNPTSKKKIPMLLNLFSGIFSIILSIFFILDGKMAKANPSINRSNPIAVMMSLTIKLFIFF